MKCMLYSSKYEAVAVPGRVGVEECYLYLILLGSARLFVFSGGGGAVFFSNR